MKNSESSASITIDDVARVAGVHRGTVSRALRGVAGKVSPEKRLAIERIAAEMGYRPNAIAASLRTKQSDIAAVVVPDLGNPLFAPIIQGLEAELSRQSLLCLVVQTPAAPEARRALVHTLAARHVAGLLILAAESDDPMLATALERRLPTVLINRGLGARQFSSVVNDDRESVRLVLEHLKSLGHRSVAHLAGPRSSSTGRSRREAFVALAREHGFEIATVVECGAFTRDAGAQAMQALLEGSHPRPSAIFAANDLIAFGALGVLREAGLEVPRDISLVGHNDMPFTDLVSPPLTTVRVAVDQMSRNAAQLFVEQLREPSMPPSTRLLMPTLVVRGSTGPVH
jgi:LacI family transcriptional regulator